MSEDIIELAQNFARAPSRYPELFDPRKPLPGNVSELLEVISGAPSTLPSPAQGPNGSDVELNEAISFFLEKVLFVGGADYYRVLGLNSGASIDQIRRNYELLINMFYQDKGKGMIQWNEANFVKINRALNTLRDPEKRIKYDRELDAKRSGVSWPPAEDLIRSHENGKNSDHQDNSNISRLNTNKRKLPKILIVDSSTELRAGLSRVLKREFECVYANNGVQGWEFLKKSNNFHLLITELNMPQLDGYMLIKKIRSSDNKRLSNLPIIVITGVQDTRAKQKAFAAGANDFLAKATDYVEMLARVRVHYKLAETTKKLEQTTEKPTEILKKIKSIKKRVGSPSSSMGAMSKSQELMVNINESKIPKKHTTRIAPMFTIVVGGLASVVIVGLLYLTQIGPENSRKENSTTASKTIKNGDKKQKNVRVPSSDGKVLMGNLDNKTDDGQGGSFGVISRQTFQFKSPSIKTAKTEVAKKPENDSREKLKIASVSPSTEKYKSAKIESTRVSRTSSQPKMIRAKPVDLDFSPKSVEQIKNTDKVFSSSKIEKKSLGSFDSKNTKDLPPKKQNADTFTNSAALKSKQAKQAKQDSGMKLSVASPPVLASVANASQLNATSTTAASGRNVAGNKVKSAAVLNQQTKPEILSKKLKPITDRDLAILIFEFVRAYEEGNLNSLLKVFDKNVQSTDGTSISTIEKDYKSLFNSTDVRHFDIPDLKWKKDQDKAIGSGNYEVKIRNKSEKQLRKFTGKITIEAQKNENGILITGFFH